MGAIALAAEIEANQRAAREADERNRQIPDQLVSSAQRQLEAIILAAKAGTIDQSLFPNRRWAQRYPLCHALH